MYDVHVYLNNFIEFCHIGVFFVLFQSNDTCTFEITLFGRIAAVLFDALY